MAASSTVSGLASGIQWKDTVEMLMQLEARPRDRLQLRQGEIERKMGAWASLQAKLESLQSASQGIDSINEMLKKEATSSDTDRMSVSASAEAVEGTHTIEINQLAQNEVFVHSDGWADLNSTPIYSGAGGKFVYDYDGETISIDVPDGATLAELVKLINDDADNPGITASTIDDGGATDPVHLVLTADEPKAANSISIDDAQTNLGDGTDFDAASWTRTKNAQSAEIRVDGYPSGGWISRSTNSISDVLEGITLSLKDTTASEITISVENDYAEIKQSVQEWVDAYNQVVKEVDTYTRYDSENKTMGVLFTDGRVKNIKADLIDKVASQIPGIDEDAVYKTLGSIGIDLTSGGKLKIDDSELQEALESDAEAVANIFTLTHSTTNDNLDYFTKSEFTEGGTYEVEAFYKADGTLDDTKNNTIGGYAATVQGDNVLVGAEDTPVAGLRIYFKDPGGGPSSLTASVTVGTGAAVLLDDYIEKATDSIDGSIKLVKDSYQSEIDSIEEQIESYNRRLEIKREMLTRQFVAMEEAVSKARNQSSFVGAM